MPEYINKSMLLEWINGEKARLIESLNGKELKSNPRKQEFVKSLDSVIGILDRFEAAVATPQEVRDEFLRGSRKAYESKREDYYEGEEGKKAIDLAIQLRQEGMSYRLICDELQLAGYKTVNGRSQWQPNPLRRLLIKNGVTE